MSRMTTDHEEIRKWVEEHGGRPAAISDTGGIDGPGILTIDFGDGSMVEPITWEEFFRNFEDKRLEFFYQDEPLDDEDARLFRFLVKDEASL